MATVEQFCNNGRIHAGEAASLHGQLNFSQGQLLGAALKPAMVYLSEIANQGWGHNHKSLLGAFYKFVKNTLQSSKPRRVTLGDETTPVVIFTDGAWEISAEVPAGAGWTPYTNKGGFMKWQFQMSWWSIGEVLAKSSS